MSIDTKEKIFDFRGMRCPVPILETGKIMKDLNVGDVAVITANDPAARSDFQAWCKRTGNSLIEVKEIDGNLQFKIKKEH